MRQRTYRERSVASITIIEGSLEPDDIAIAADVLATGDSHP